MGQKAAQQARKTVELHYSVYGNKSECNLCATVEFFDEHTYKTRHTLSPGKRENIQHHAHIRARHTPSHLSRGWIWEKEVPSTRHYHISHFSRFKTCKFRQTRFSLRVP